MKNQNNNIPEEEWRDIPNYEGYYQISSRGRVKSVERTIRDKNGRLCRKNEHIFKLNRSHKGSYKVCLCRNNRRAWIVVIMMADRSISVGTVYSVFSNKGKKKKRTYIPLPLFGDI